jgi:hypothetical protein
MARRLCQYCETPLGRLAKLLHIYNCRDCAYRMSHGGQPLRPPKRTEN